MGAALVFFGIAAVVGLLIRGFVELRLRRAVARQPDIPDAELCELKQANRISSMAIIASLVGLALVALVLVIV
jgi:hypothetical protein